MTMLKNLLPGWVVLLSFCTCTGTNTEHASGMAQSVKEKHVETGPFPEMEPGKFNLTEAAFGPIVELKGVPVENDLIFNSLEMEMMVSGKVLVIKSLVNQGMIKFIQLPDLNLLREVGLRGRGPGELQSPRLIATSAPDLLCHLYDTRQDKVFTIDTGYTLKESGFYLTKPSNELFGNKQFVEMANRDFYYVSNSVTGKGVYHYLPDYKDSLKLVLDLEKGFDRNLNWGSLIGVFGGRSQKERLVYAYKYFHRIIFYDPTSQNSRILQFQAPLNNKTATSDPRAVMTPDNITHYWCMSVQPEHVYCSYSGRTPIEVKREMDLGEDFIIIEQFDWNGNPVKRFKLDHWGYFCVDEPNRCIYLAPVDDEESFYRYHF